MRKVTRICQVVIGLFVLGGMAAAQPVTEALDYGPHPVGFRTVTEIDQSRIVQARTTFDGKPIPGEPAMPMQIGIWYPAGASTGARMTAEQYKTVWEPQTRQALAADFSRMVGFGGLAATEAQAVEALTRPTRAHRDAPVAPGRFPLIIAGASVGLAWFPLEYFASHGYVVVSSWSSRRTATLQATRPAIALETQTRNLEYLLGFVRRQALGDESRLGVLGVNFDGMAALNFEMRNMRADAVISVDGYEGKTSGTAMLRDSPHFDPLRLRVPYLIFVQDENDPPPQLVHDRTIWDALRYATRYWYVLNGFNHGRLISDVANVSTLTADQRAGHTFIVRTMRRFLDAYVKRDADARSALENGPSDGLPDPVRKVAVTAVALPPAPTSEEFERLVMEGPIERAALAYRQARERNPQLRIFDESTIGLYAFRYTQRKQLKEALELRRLAAEAFAESPTAAYQLGLTATDAGQPVEARAAFDRALKLLDASTSMPPERRDALRKEIQGRRY